MKERILYEMKVSDPGSEGRKGEWEIVIMYKEKMRGREKCSLKVEVYLSFSR